jgi:outer membrane protein assembly factor BamB
MAMLGRILPAMAGILSAALLGAGLEAADWPTWGGREDRNMVSGEKGLPVDFDPGDLKADAASQKPGRNVRWVVPLGSRTFSTPVVSGGRVFIGTNNDGLRDAKYPGDRGVLLCLKESDGSLLWQLVTTRPAYDQLGLCSPPTVEGDRLYVLTGRSEVLCVDVKGLADGNDGPFVEEASYFARTVPQRLVKNSKPPRNMPPPVELGERDADILWRYDAMAELNVFPHDAANSAALIIGDTLFVGTSNNIDGPHARQPGSKVPALIALDKKTGRLLGVDDAGIAERLYHGGWSSPSLGMVGGKPLVFYGGGDGWCYAFDANVQPGADGRPGVIRCVWRFNCNALDMLEKDGTPIPYKAPDGPSEILATPVFHRGRVYVAIGQDPDHGTGRGRLVCIDASGAGDVTATALVWDYRDINRSISTVGIADGLVYAADRAGVMHGLDADTGKAYWKHNTGGAIWASPLVADGKVYVGNRNGLFTVLAAGKEKRVLSTVNLATKIHPSPIAANGVLYIANENRLWAVSGR